MSSINEESTTNLSIVELDSFLSTPEQVEGTLTTPRRSSRKHKPSTPFGVDDSSLLTSTGTPNSTEHTSSSKENRKKKFAKGWVFSTPTSTPKKSVRTPDSKNNSSPTVVTPQKNGNGNASDSGSLTPSKGVSSDSLNLNITPLKAMSSSTMDSLKWSGPSPYKSHRPKYLPKNIKLLKKKYKERQENLESLEKVDEQLLQATKTLSEDTNKFNLWRDTTAVSDPMGTVLPITDVFSPQSYFVSFDELSLDVNDFVSSDSRFAFKGAAEIVEGLTNGTLLITTPSEFRYCSHLLTVTTNRSVYDSILPFVQRRITLKNFLAWTDLKAILTNFGLTLSTPSCMSKSSKKPPQKWNLEFLFFIISNSFEFYKLSCVKRLLSFLVDSLFESILIDLHNTVVLIVRQVTKHLLKKKVTVEDLNFLVNRSYLSSVHNRFIFQYLASDPELVTLARDLGIRTVCDIVNIPFSSGDLEFSQIMLLLTENFDFIVKLNVKHITQLLLICEKLFLLSGFDPCHVEKLASFVKQISTSYTHFDRLTLNGTVNRLEALASCRSY
ncbi:hypothetical protein GE061_016668 [Apolygus lucorum]|uniref:Uncharacterized protein n=1 Tax=Apolygus lucorum TaxID=248454 RepID=A0A6A4K292_APOLU|nr:hypothetical protein GE061_016668 [Apolygus lucorum]